MKYLDYDKRPELNRRTAARFDTTRLVQLPGESSVDYVDLVKFFGKDSLDPATVAVNHVDSEYAFADPRVAEYSQEIVHLMRQEGRLHDGPLVTRIVSMSPTGVQQKLTIQPVNYDLFASTCLALDYRHPIFDKFGGTLRSYYLSQMSEHGKRELPFPTCLGTCGLLLVDTEEFNEVLLTERSANLSSLEQTVGTSAAGMVDYATGFRTLADMIDQSMRQEVREELNLSDDEFEIVPLAMATELFRGEHLQFFCLVSTPLSQQQVIEKMESIPKGRREFESIRFFELEDHKQAAPIDLPVANYEAHMNLFLVKQATNVKDSQ